MSELPPPEIAAAYKEAQLRGLPEGWTCSIDKRNRRKWTAPDNGRSCDSIPKAITISVELGLLPEDTTIPSGRNKKSRSIAKAGRPRKRVKHDKRGDEADAVASLLSMVSSSAGNSASRNMAPIANKDEKQSEAEDSSEDESDEDDGPPIVPMDPETTIDVYNPILPVTRKEAALPCAVHWNPNSPNGRKIGWKVKIENEDSVSGWTDGRIVRYDPHTHKHKVQFAHDHKKHCWIWLRNEQHNIQLATRMVWAHVKGYAWWPGLVMESNSKDSKTKDGYVLIEFFVTGEISCLRDTPESIRPFHADSIDPVVAKHRKKRNQKAYQMAMEECMAIQKTRNQAALYYAKAALDMACYYAPKNSNANSLTETTGTALLGKRVQIFRPDIDYPYGDTVVGKVRQYSALQNKWLLSFELSELQNNKSKYSPAWINVYSKEHNLKIIDKGSIAEKSTSEDLLPFLFGYETSCALQKESECSSGSEHAEILELMNSRCRGCVEYLKTSVSVKGSSDQVVVCEVCRGSFHLGCVDPPLTSDQWQRMTKNGVSSYCCVRCTPCRGCYENDVSFGSFAHPNPPSTLSLPQQTSSGGGGKMTSLDLCFTCKRHYDADRFCCNCGHIWDDKKFGMIRRQIEYGSNSQTGGRKRKGGSSRFEDTGSQVVFGYFEGDEVWPLDAKVDPSYYFPETSEWGYTEDEMLVCDSCNIWVHAACSGMTENEYEITSNGDHPIYSKEFLCRMCCRARCKQIITALHHEDKKSLFAAPVAEKVVPNYLDLIKEPMDLKTMLEKAVTDDYVNYVWVREHFELMTLNALTFNRYYTEVWRESKRFYLDSLKNVFAKLGKAAPPGKLTKNIRNCFAIAEEARKNEEERVQIDETVEKKDLVAGSAAVMSITLPKFRTAPPDVSSCVPFREVRLKPVDAFFCSWMDCCFTCGSSGAADTFLFCVDCAEAFHSFCVSAPVHSMELSSVAAWRCPNCKICEISGDVPADETRMLVCEMCDRGFSLDLVDPPLTSAPSGLWVCGQCVDCKICRNKGEKKGVSLKYWSQDPEKCFRCGGCDGFDAFVSEGNCQICAGALRASDDDVVKCSKCSSKVHLSCDERAEEWGDQDEPVTKSQGTIRLEYLCPRCYTPTARAAAGALRDDNRRILSSCAQQLLVTGSFGVPDIYSTDEMHQKLVDEMDWETRNLWRDEYIAIIRDAVGLYCMAKSLGDPRFVIQQVLQRMHQLPRWLGHRALRFAVLVKRKKWDTVGFVGERADVVVLTAKLAAAFIDVVCRTLGINKDREVSFAERQGDLIQAPNEIGEFHCPFDPIREIESIALDDDGCVVVVDKETGNLPLSVELVRRGVSSNTTASHSIFKIAGPLCGWSSLVSSPVGVTKWNDPRECCLCHLCGDSDAGLPDEVINKDLNGLGRLLPMPDGYWVHASCALWSSEVWETSDDGLIHAVEKARSRGSQLKCFGCGFSGATVGCNKSNCPYNYHLPCARACMAVFTSNQQVFCASHKSYATSVISKESCELMKALMIAPDKQKSGTDRDNTDNAEADLYYRLGCLVVHSLGTIEQNVDGFHSKDYITPPGFVASRIYWSARHPRTRTAYILKIEKTPEDRPRFVCVAGDDPTAKIIGSSAAQVYSMLMKRVQTANAIHFSQGDLYSKCAVVRKTNKRTYGLNGAQFFGFGLNSVRRLLEAHSGVEAVVAPLTPGVSPQYHFCFAYGPGGSDSSVLVDLIRDTQRKRAAAKAELSLQNSTGCARTEGIRAVVKSGGSGRITRALVRIAAEDESGDSGLVVAKKGEDKTVTDRNLFQVKYRQMRSTPIEQRLSALRSHIHGWGLFTKLDIMKHDPVVEYMGEVIRRPVADIREKAYELSGEGSCFMFRLDLTRIIDATKIGCMARFMNHSCQPNAYAKIVNVETDFGQDKKIVVFANRDIAAGEEVTYDYKFPVEDGSLKCMCGAPNCIGRLN